MACMKRTDHSGGSDRMTATVSGPSGYSLDTGVQAIQLSPCHPGLAGPAAWRLHGIPAFPTCCFPLWLSLSGRSGGPGAMLCCAVLLSLFPLRLTLSGRTGCPRALHSTPPVLHRDQPRRDATHFHSTAPPAHRMQRKRSRCANAEEEERDYSSCRVGRGRTRPASDRGRNSSRDDNQDRPHRPGWRPGPPSQLIREGSTATPLPAPTP